MELELKSSDVKKVLIPWLKRLAAVSKKWCLYGDYVVQAQGHGCKSWTTIPIGSTGATIFPFIQHPMKISFDGSDMENPIDAIGTITGKNSYRLLLNDSDGIFLHIISNTGDCLVYRISISTADDTKLGDKIPHKIATLLNHYSESWALDSSVIQSLRSKDMITLIVPSSGDITSKIRISKKKFPFIGSDSITRDPKYTIRYGIGTPNLLTNHNLEDISNSIANVDTLGGLLVHTKFFGDLTFDAYTEYMYVVY